MASGFVYVFRKAFDEERLSSSSFLFCDGPNTHTHTPHTHTHRCSYLARIDSFTVSRWFAKPAALSPLECARYGWKTTAPDRLECSLCAARLICVIGQGEHPPSHSLSFDSDRPPPFVVALLWVYILPCAPCLE
jgi:hypothetical protein